MGRCGGAPLHWTGRPLHWLPQRGHHRNLLLLLLGRRGRLLHGHPAGHRCCCRGARLRRPLRRQGGAAAAGSKHRRYVALLQAAVGAWDRAWLLRAGLRPDSTLLRGCSRWQRSLRMDEKPVLPAPSTDSKQNLRLLKLLHKPDQSALLQGG